MGVASGGFGSNYGLGEVHDTGISRISIERCFRTRQPEQNEPHKTLIENIGVSLSPLSHNNPPIFLSMLPSPFNPTPYYTPLHYNFSMP